MEDVVCHEELCNNWRQWLVLLGQDLKALALFEVLLVRAVRARKSPTPATCSAAVLEAMRELYEHCAAGAHVPPLGPITAALQRRAEADSLVVLELAEIIATV